MSIFNFDAYLFDMDGVIADSNPTHKLAFQQFLASKGIDCTDAFFEQHIAGSYNEAIVKSILGQDTAPEVVKEWSDAKEQLWRELFTLKPVAIAGAIDFIKKLHGLGKKLAVCTSAPVENMDFVLDAFELRPYFSVTLCEKDVTKHKPNPDVYVKAAELLQVAPERALVLEDSAKGAAAGLAAGCAVVTVNNPNLVGPPYWAAIKDFTTLQKQIV